jgi:polar amino acid transport system substrate-binding protein
MEASSVTASKSLLCTLTAFATLGAIHGAAAEPLTLGYLSRPGFAEMVDGKPAGAFLPIAADAVAKAGVEVTWQALPQKRLIEQVAQDTANYCAVGIYKTPEREAFAKFSAAFYRDKPFVVVSTTAKEAEIKAHKGLMDLMADASQKLGAIEGFSYGREIDVKIKTMSDKVDLAVVTPDKIVAKVAAGRDSYMLAAPEEFAIAVKQSGANAADLAQIAFPDIPQGAQRHFMCSKSVDDATIAKLSAGISSLNLGM